MTEEIAVDGVAPMELTTGEVSRRTQLSVDALRYYEREQLLLGTIRRDSAGRRTYTSEDVDWILTCINMRATGMPINDVRLYTRLVREGEGTESERMGLLERVSQR